jgi:hypothetical protein
VKTMVSRSGDKVIKVWVQLLKTLLKSTLENSKESTIALYWLYLSYCFCVNVCASV